MKTTATWLLWRLGISAFARHILTCKGRFVLMFHGISSQKHPHLPVDAQPYLSKDDLRAILSWLQKRFDFLSPKEFFETGKRGVLLTFDDGFANNRHNAVPALEEFQAPAVFFISAQHVANVKNWLPATRAMARKVWPDITQVPPEIAADFYNGMSEEDLVWCANHPLITIGGHTTSHPFLTQSSAEILEKELVESKSYLEKLAGQAVDLFAYPTGDYNQEVTASVWEAGYRAAFVMEDSLPIGQFHLEIPRVGIYNSHPAYLSLKLSGLYRRPIKPYQS